MAQLRESLGNDFDTIIDDTHYLPEGWQALVAAIGARDGTAQLISERMWSTWTFTRDSAHRPDQFFAQGRRIKRYTEYLLLSPCNDAMFLTRLRQALKQHPAAPTFHVFTKPVDVLAYLNEQRIFAPDQAMMFTTGRGRQRPNGEHQAMYTNTRGRTWCDLHENSSHSNDQCRNQAKGAKDRKRSSGAGKFCEHHKQCSHTTQECRFLQQATDACSTCGKRHSPGQMCKRQLKADQKRVYQAHLAQQNAAFQDHLAQQNAAMQTPSQFNHQPLQLNGLLAAAQSTVQQQHLAAQRIPNSQNSQTGQNSATHFSQQSRTNENSLDSSYSLDPYCGFQWESAK